MAGRGCSTKGAHPSTPHTSRGRRRGATRGPGDNPAQAGASSGQQAGVLKIKPANKPVVLFTPPPRVKHCH